MFRQTLFDRLASSQNVLIVGAGGGFDVFSGLPLYFELCEAGKTVHLASLTFTYLGATQAEHLGHGVFRVDHDTDGPDQYFPEKHLSRWLADHGHEQPVWCLERQGVQGLRSAYLRLEQRLGFDTVVLVDGGTDALMRGDEAGLGTPAEDVSSILAAEVTNAPNKLLICLGFGVDRHHGICHAHFLEAVAELSQSGGYLGAWALTPGMRAVDRYVEATEYVQERTPGRESIVCASVVSAMEGRFGDYHRLDRTAHTGSRMWINPLMSMYWAFDLQAVADRILYRDFVEDTQSFGELHARIEAYRKTITPREWTEIPL